MTRVYRILRRRYARSPLDGEGAFLFGGRRSSPGVRIAYTAEHLSLAMLQHLVHLATGNPPKDRVVVAAGIPGHVSHEVLKPGALPRYWHKVPPHPALAAIGDSFAAHEKVAVLVVPSALVLSESNWLINPFHPQSAEIRVHAPERFKEDPWLIR